MNSYERERAEAEERERAQRLATSDREAQARGDGEPSEHRPTLYDQIKEKVSGRCKELNIWRFTEWCYVVLFFTTVAIVIITAIPFFDSHYKTAKKWTWQWERSPIVDIVPTTQPDCPTGYVPTGPNEYSVSASGRRSATPNTLWCTSRLCAKRSKYFSAYWKLWDQKSCKSGYTLCPTGGCVPDAEYPDECPITAVTYEAATAETDPARIIECDHDSTPTQSTLALDRSGSAPLLGLVSTPNSSPRFDERPGGVYEYDVKDTEEEALYTAKAVTSLPADAFYDYNGTPLDMRRPGDPAANNQVSLFAVYSLTISSQCARPYDFVAGMEDYSQANYYYTPGFYDDDDDYELSLFDLSTRQLLIALVTIISIVAVVYIVLAVLAYYYRRDEEKTLFYLVDLGRLAYLAVAIVLWMSISISGLFSFTRDVKGGGCFPAADPVGQRFERDISKMHDHLVTIVVTSCLGLVLFWSTLCCRLNLCCEYDEADL